MLFGNKGPIAKDVIEIFGGEGTGKTEILVHLIVRCLLPETWNNIPLHGRDAGVILIDTDLKFSILHLVSRMEKYIYEKAEQIAKKSEIESVGLENFIKSCLKKLHIVRCFDSGQLVLTLHNLENLVCNEANISVIMLDSISAFYWIDKLNGGDSVPVQEANMKYASEILSKLVNTYNLNLFATKAAVFKKKGNTEYYEDQENPERNDARELPEDLDSLHAEFMCKPWQRLVSHRLVLVKDIKAGNQSFVIGGDCVQGNSRFTISGSGIQFF